MKGSSWDNKIVGLIGAFAFGGCALLRYRASLRSRVCAKRFTAGSTLSGSNTHVHKKWPTVAVIGVGQLGAAVAGNLLRNGVTTILHDINGDKNVPDAVRESIKGGIWVTTGREAAERADVVVTALPRPEHVTSAFEGSNGFGAGFTAGMTWIEHSTTDFRNTLKIRDKLHEIGASCVEAPFTGGMQILREGKMVTFVGADPHVLEGDIADIIALSAPRIVRCGEFGHATIIKVWSNVLCAAMDVHIGETLACCKKAGLDMRLTFDAMRVSSGNSFCWETEVPIMLQGDFFPNFTADMMLKDIELTLDLTKRYGVPTPMTNFIRDRYKEAIKKYGPSCGSSATAKLNEDESNVVFSEGPGNAKEHFSKWSYTSEMVNGSYNIVHQNYENAFLQEPFTTYSPPMSEVEALREEVKALQAKVKSLEAERKTR